MVWSDNMVRVRRLQWRGNDTVGVIQVDTTIEVDEQNLLEVLEYVWAKFISMLPASGGVMTWWSLSTIPTL